MGNRAGKLKRCFVILLFSLLVSLSLTKVNCAYFVVEYEDLHARILNAEMELEGSFEAVLEAEAAGANVSQLISRLNAAGALLAEASMALRVGESADVDFKVDRCMEIARAVRSEAQALKEAALIEGKRLFWMNVALSSIGVAIFLVLLLFVWRGFRRYYVRKLLGMRPEVSFNVES